MGRTCCHTAAWKGTAHNILDMFWRVFKEENKNYRELTRFKLNVVLTFFHFFSEEAFSLKSSVCEMCFGFNNMTSYPGKRCLQESMSVCMEVLYRPCKRFTTSRVCSNSLKCNYLEKVNHKNMQFKENGVKQS